MITLRDRLELNETVTLLELYVRRPDGRLNCDISNLMLLTKGENAVLTRLGLRSEDPDLTEAGLNLVRLKQAAKDARKRKKK